VSLNYASRVKSEQAAIVEVNLPAKRNVVGDKRDRNLKAEERNRVPLELAEKLIGRGEFEDGLFACVSPSEGI
jgi:hypothetical protein